VTATPWRTTASGLFIDGVGAVRELDGEAILRW
jgi:hypothetical protein